MFSRKVILRALICAFLAMIPFREQENQLYDLKLRLLSHLQFQRPDSVVLVEISKEDFEDLKRRFPSGIQPEGYGIWRERFEALRNQFLWDDRVYEGLLSRVLSENPRRFLVTFFYSENLVSLPNGSPLQRLARNPSVLWASQFDLDGKIMQPAPELTGTENYGFSNLQPDADGVVRRAHLVYRNHISLPFRTLLDSPDSLRQGLPLTEPFLVHYVGRPGFISRCHATDLFAEVNSCGSLKDKYVILAPTENAVAGANLYRTSVGFMSRGEVLANILLTAKNDNAFFFLNPYLLFLLALAHALMLARVILRSGGQLQLFWTVGLLLGESLLSMFTLYFFSLQIPLTPFLISTASAYFAFLALKFAKQETKRWQAEKKALYLRELDELKSNFLSLMSHDLKTPIAKVQALTERLEREASSLTPDQKEILAAIQRSNEELATYILSILNFQRIESQELKPHKKSTDINLLIEEVIHRVEALAEEKQIRIEKELEPMFAIEFDEQLIRQVLNNLIDNAIKYNQPGTVVTVRSTDLESYVEVSVEDNGVGIEEKQMDRLFKKFSRSEKGTTERVKGTGLGLYLAKYFIELHDGNIEVESKVGEGTKFRFRLPVQS